MNKIFSLQSEVRAKVQLTESIYELKYEIPSDFIFTPGQFVGIRVIPTHTRAYSIVEVKDNLLCLLADVKPGGLASKYFEKVTVGEKTHILGPYGRYFLKETDLTKIFISAGTGIAPFIPMIKQLRLEKPHVKVKNFFGTRYIKDDIAFPYLNELIGENFEYSRCVSREDVADSMSFQGRATVVIPNLNLDWANSEFYICGSNDLVIDMSNELIKLGADKIYFEKYG